MPKLNAIWLMGVVWAALAAPVFGQLTSRPAEEVTTQPADQGVDMAPDRTPIAVRRVIKSFDFDERRFNNYTNLPGAWRRHGGQGFPVYLEGRFDPDEGHGAAPSFRLDLDGGSLAYRYEGRDISVRPNSDYMIVTWVKSSGLETARAYLTASFLDRKGVRIPGTEQRSALVGGVVSDSDWQSLSLRMRCDDPTARYVGLSVWLVQKKFWHQGPQRLREIEHEDIKATAWFDDISVYRMPRVSLRTVRPGSIFGKYDPVELLAEVSDPDGLKLTAQLIVYDADGQLIERQEIPVQVTGRQEMHRVIYRDLPVGAYYAELFVTTDDVTLTRQWLRFVRVADRISPPAATGRGFGVTLEDIHPALLPGQRELLRALSPQFIKVPVWSAQQAFAGQPVDQKALDAYLETGRETRSDPIGILMDDRTFEPGSSNSQLMSMLDMFNEDPLAWKHLIGGIWSRYAGLIHVWQIGADGDDWVILDERIGALIPRLRKEMAELMSEPRLATIASVYHEAPGVQVGNCRSVFVPATVGPSDLSGQLEPLLSQDRSQSWVTVEPLPVGPYPRRQRLGDLAKRLIEARYQGVGAVFMNAPWGVRVDQLGARVDPCEDYIIFRTVADVLGDAKPVSRTTINGQVQCTVFDRNKMAILCVWDDYAPPEGRLHRIMLGEEIQQVDLWGQVSTPQTVGSCQLIRVGPTPTFILNSLTWLIEFRRQFVVKPPVLEASFDNLDRHIEFTNTYHESISGLIRLKLAEDWDIRPNRFPFTLSPGEVFSQKIAIRFPLNAQAQVMPILAECTIEADRRYKFTTPAWFDFSLEGIDLDAFAYRTGSLVKVKLSMTNRTPDVVHFEGYVVAPGRQRIERVFSNFQPGQSLTRTFVLSDAAGLAGNYVRVGLKELQGSRLWNQVIAVP